MEKVARQRKWTRFAICALVAGALVLGLSYVGVACFTADRLTRASNHPLAVDPYGLSPDVEAWSTRTADGVTLRGWYLPTKDRRQLIVLVHGLWSSWLEMAGLGRDLHRKGFDVLLFDLRGHGQSDPSRVYLGRRERYDIRAVMTWAECAGFEEERIGWLGYSMGASTLLMEAARNPRIRAAVMDSPYGDLPKLLNSQLTKHSGLPRWFNPGILLAARYCYGVRTDDLVPIRFAKSWGERPLLLIHGECDSIVPVAQAQQLAQAIGGSCLTLTLPGVDHVKAYQSDPEHYVKLVGGFFADHLTQ
jgi:pimeloyl-ACP methyl ester carboxylesterase